MKRAMREYLTNQNDCYGEFHMAIKDKLKTDEN